MTRLQRFMEVDTLNYEEKNNPNYITTFFCAYKIGLAKTCLNEYGDCKKCWNMEWNGDYKEIE